MSLCATVAPHSHRPRTAQQLRAHTSGVSLTAVRPPGRAEPPTAQDGLLAPSRLSREVPSLGVSHLSPGGPESKALCKRKRGIMNKDIVF